MKKILYLISICFVVLTYFSCNNDDDNDIVTTDKIIGKWQFSQEFFNNEEIELTVCDKKMTLQFFENGTYIEEDFEMNDTQTACISAGTITETWENLGGSKYKITMMSTPGMSITLNVTVTFETNKMTVVYSEAIDGEEILVKAVFIKVT